MRIITVMLLCLVLGGAAAGASSSDIKYEPFPEKLLLRMETQSPFAGDLEKLTRIPEFSLYGDGTVLFTKTGPDEIVELMKATLEPGEMEDLISFIRSQGILEWDESIEKCPLENMPTTMITLRSLTANRKIKIYGLAYAAGDGQLPPGIAGLHARLSSFSHPSAEPYKPAKIRLFVRRIGNVDKSKAKIETWKPGITLANVTGSSSSPHFKEKIYEGRNVNGLLKFLNGKVLYGRKVINLFFSQKKEIYEVGFRPVLPEE
jgi:hypothetical protein